jgi:hypothetical protein
MVGDYVFEPYSKSARRVLYVDGGGAILIAYDAGRGGWPVRESIILRNTTLKTYPGSVWWSRKRDVTAAFRGDLIPDVESHQIIFPIE